MIDRTIDNRKERSIRRVLRRKHSKEYFTGDGWTSDLEKARTFRDCVEAAQTCSHCGLSGIELVLRVKGGNADLFCTELR